VNLFTIDEVFGGWQKAQKPISPTAVRSIRSINRGANHWESNIFRQRDISTARSA
jgi:hypothetical protein